MYIFQSYSPSGYVRYHGDLAKKTEKRVQRNNNYVCFTQVSLLISNPEKDMLHHQGSLTDRKDSSGVNESLQKPLIVCPSFLD